MRPHSGQMAAVGQPSVEGPGDDLLLHRVADGLDVDAGGTVGHDLLF